VAWPSRTCSKAKAWTSHVSSSGTAGDSEDIDYLTKLLERGSYIGMDRFGLDVYLPTDKRVA